MTAPPAPAENGGAAPADEKGALDKHKIKALRVALPQVLATSAKNLILLGYGMTLGFPTITIPAISAGSDSGDVLQLTKDQISWFSSINLICVPVGCLASGPLTQPIGRKRSMQFINLPFIAAWLVFHFASSLTELYLALVLVGLAGGLMEAPVLTYVAEITQPHLRGMLSATSSMCVILGVFVQFLLGNFLPWRTVAAVNACFPAIAAISLFFVPESPYWLVSKGRVREAERSLCWLRGWVQPSAVAEELQQLRDSLQQKHKQLHMGGDKEAAAAAAAAAAATPRGEAWWRPYTRRTFLQPYLLVAVSFFVGHFSGMTTLQTYSVSIFTTLGAPIDKYVATLYLGLAELAGTLVCVILVHWAGKRPLTFVSTLGCGACFTAVATYAYIHSGADADAARPHAWLPLTLLLASAFLSHSGIRLLPWILIGEVYPAAVRGVASGASGSIGYIFSFAANKSYFFMLEGLTLWGTFYLYGAVAAAGAVFLYFQLPETEGRTLHEIQQHYSRERDLLSPRRDERRRRRLQQPALAHAHAHGDAPARGPEKYAATNPALVLDDVESRL
ncbi:hypothetical protein R5R35_002295 [Gryllus longicercus]|uniref:Major facilitator superfamily (MFS) profile domain-containing protein n=1 Tax=Gryllus longicercus TaxID=2509291 RepID=A0AAN9ZCF2_9ORTH